MSIANYPWTLGTKETKPMKSQDNVNPSFTPFFLLTIFLPASGSLHMLFSIAHSNSYFQVHLFLVSHTYLWVLLRIQMVESIEGACINSTTIYTANNGQARPCWPWKYRREQHKAFTACSQQRRRPQTLTIFQQGQHSGTGTYGTGSSRTACFRMGSGATLSGFSHALSFITCVASDYLLNLSRPQFPHLQNEEDDSNCILRKELLWWLNEVIHGRHLEEYLHLVGFVLITNATRVQRITRLALPGDFSGDWL